MNITVGLRKTLCDWLKENEPNLLNNSKLQFFLFFYECFSIIDGDPEASSEIVNNRALLSAFIVKIMKENELLEFVSSLNIWKSVEIRNEQGIDLSNLNQRDIDVLQLLKTMYPIGFIKDAYLIEENNKIFLFSKKDSKMLADKHKQVLKQLDKELELCNPIYVSIEDGVLCVD